MRSRADPIKRLSLPIVSLWHSASRAIPQSMMASTVDDAQMVDESMPASVPHQGEALGDADSEPQPEPALGGQTSECRACPHAHLGRAHQDNLLTFALL